MEADRITLKALVSAAAGIVALEALARFAIAAGVTGPLAGTGIVRLLDIAVLAAVLPACRLRGSAVGLERSGWRSGLRRGILWSIAFGVAAGVGFAAAHLAGQNPLRLLRSAGGLRQEGIVLYFLVGGLIGPIAEEFFFRGYLYGSVRRWGAPAAILSSTACFALVHPAAGGLPVVQIVGGLVFALAYELEKNLLVPLSIHVLGNFAIFALPLLPL
jgi:membrane protease YdiL (CAAX protease family)